MVVTTQKPVVVPLPHEPHHSVSIRRLTYGEIEAAQEAWRRKYFAAMDSISDSQRKLVADAAKALASKAGQDGAPQAAADPVNPLLCCDKTLALRAGICGWTYSDEVTDANKDALDHRTARTVWDALVELHDPLASGAASTSR